MLSEEATLDDARKADMQMYNTALRLFYAAWEEVNTIQAALAMMGKTFDFIEKRRAILGLPYGSPANKESKQIVFSPLD